jgi:sortase A
VRLVEEPELGVAGDQRGEGGAPPLPCAEAPGGEIAEPPAQAEAIEHGIECIHGPPGGAYGEADVVGHREVVIEGGRVPDEAEAPTDGPSVDTQVVAEDDRGPVDEGDQPGDGAQERGLPGAVRPGEEHHLTRADVEVDAGEGGEASEEADGGAKVDGEAHDSAPRLPADDPEPPRQRPTFSATFREALDAAGPAPAPIGAQPRVLGPEPDDVAASALAAASARATSATTHEPGVRPARRFDVSVVLSGVGKTMIVLGLVVLGFVAFELKGTDIVQQRTQTKLLEGFDVPAPPGSLTTSELSGEPAPPNTPDGEAVARIKIPKIGVDQAVVEGVELSQLRKGPGHYKGTPLPGQPGNASIAGHRTTYGHPFFYADALRPGDPILVSTQQGKFRYEVREVKVVKPGQVEVVAPTSDNRLTLTTCNPRFSAAQRLVVVADLKGPAANPTPRLVEKAAKPEELIPTAPTFTEVVGASGDPSAEAPSAVWAFAALGVGLFTWALGRRWRRLPAWTLGTLPLLACLWQFYSYLARALPS